MPYPDPAEAEISAAELPGKVRQISQILRSIQRVFAKVLNIDENDPLDRKWLETLQKAVLYAISMQEVSESTDDALKWVAKHIKEDLDDDLKWMQQLRAGDIKELLEWVRNKKQAESVRQEQEEHRRNKWAARQRWLVAIIATALVTEFAKDFTGLFFGGHHTP